MTDDRALLEAAAKAAGIALVWNDAGCPGYYSEWRGLPQWEEWNPLADDGDALRLAVKLGMELDASTDPVCAGDGIVGVREPYRGDPYAATRRAIVRAATAMKP